MFLCFPSLFESIVVLGMEDGQSRAASFADAIFYLQLQVTWTVGEPDQNCLAMGQQNSFYGNINRQEIK